MPHDHYEFLRHELDTLRVGLDSLHAERDKLVAERDQLRRDVAELHERLSYHMRIASGRLSATASAVFTD